MANNISTATEIHEMVKPRIMESLALAKRRMANIPLGQKKLDPRTIKKREEESQIPPGMDSTLGRMLYEMRNGK